MVCDLRGGLPTSTCHIDAIADARCRLMKPEGTLIPLRDTILVAPVEAGEAYSKLESPWRDEPFGLEMTGAAAASSESGGHEADLPRPAARAGDGRSPRWSTLPIDSPNIDAKVELPVEADWNRPRAVGMVRDRAG